MTFKRVIYASTLAAGVGIAGLVGVGLGTASAEPTGMGLLVRRQLDSAVTGAEGSGQARYATASRIFSAAALSDAMSGPARRISRDTAGSS
jgi:hypothetical protein